MVESEDLIMSTPSPIKRSRRESEVEETGSYF